MKVRLSKQPQRQKLCRLCTIRITKGLFCSISVLLIQRKRYVINGIGRRMDKGLHRQLSIYPMKTPTGCCMSTTALLLVLNIIFSQADSFNTGYDQTGWFACFVKWFVTIRIFEPASKLRSLELMEQFFGICHSAKHTTRLPWLYQPKENSGGKGCQLCWRSLLVQFRHSVLRCNNTLFETFEEDELRKNSFQKTTNPTTTNTHSPDGK